jgi:hypothetical protein
MSEVEQIIQLDQFLKVIGLVNTGGQAKIVIQGARCCSTDRWKPGAKSSCGRAMWLRLTEKPTPWISPGWVDECLRGH